MDIERKDIGARSLLLVPFDEAAIRFAVNKALGDASSSIAFNLESNVV